MRANPLGDLRAESDERMLESAFQETADFKTLIGETDRPIVIGRRGTGKSALAYRLKKHWRGVEHTTSVLVAPAENQVIGLRALMPEYFGQTYRMIRAGSRLAWRYALLAEAAHALTRHYKLGRSEYSPVVRQHAHEWTDLGADISERLRRRLRQVGLDLDSTGRLAEIAHLLHAGELETALVSTVSKLKEQVVILIDRVDEGYEPDETGVAMIDGLVLAAIDLNTRVDGLRVTLFLRDNMARAVEQLDPDYSRDIEGQVLRLHWEESQLFSLICSRLRVAFAIDLESDLKVWNRCTAADLQGRDGFKRCLRHTLYRPRDVVSLLNETFLFAARESRQQIIATDIEHTAKTISRIRLDDLHKEYRQILPGLEEFTAQFKEGPRAMSLRDANDRVQKAGGQTNRPEAAAQTFALLDTASDVGAALYSVGFLGVKDPGTGEVAFCHDGRMLDRPLEEEDTVMVHPCYRMALGISERDNEADQVEGIFDDYDIRVISQTPEVRKAKLSKLVGELERLEHGDDSAHEFEDWCQRVIQVIFASQLTNIELRPNKNSVQRRDVVATNHGRSEFWRRVLDDYDARQVVFEVKNYVEIGPDEYRQMASYLGDPYGRIGFLITRTDDENLEADNELAWVREIYNRQKKLVILLPGRFFSRTLSKLRSPQRHDEADQQLNKLLDKYLRLYLGEQVGGRKRPRSSR